MSRKLTIKQYFDMGYQEMKYLVGDIIITLKENDFLTDPRLNQYYELSASVYEDDHNTEVFFQ